MAKRRLTRFLPWLVALVIIAAVLTRFDARVILAHMRRGRWQSILPFAVGLPFGHLLLGAIWDRQVFQRALGGPRYVDLLRGRAGASMLMVLGYVAGHGAFGLWIAKKTKTSAARVSASVFYTVLCDLGALGLVATASTMIGGADVPAAVRRAAIIAPLIPLVLGVVVPRVARSPRLRIFVALRTLPPWVALAQMFGRAINIALVIVLMWNGARGFGLTIPAGVFATYMPVVLLATSLPFNIAGLGASQAAWLVFLPWAEGEHLIAFQLLWQFFYGGALLVRGAPFVRSVARDIRPSEGAP